MPRALRGRRSAPVRTINAPIEVEGFHGRPPGRVEDWCRVLRSVLQPDQVCAIGHYTGAVSVFASSPVAEVVSCGFEVHEFWALVPGERADWLRFAAALESALGAAELPYSLVVHEGVLVRE